MKPLVMVLYQEGMYDQCAYAIEDAMIQLYTDCDVVMIDENKYVNFYSSRISKNVYKFTARNLPLFNWLSKPLNEKTKIKEHKNKNNVNGNEEPFRNIKIKFRKVENAIKRFNPDVILCLTPKAHDKAIKAKNRLKSDVLVYALMTDYCLNPKFINSLSDGYFVQNELLGQALQTKGIDAKKIKVCGTPLITGGEQYDIMALRKKYGIDNDFPVVTIVGGRYGCDYVKDAFTALAEYHTSVNILVLSSASKSIEKFVNMFCKTNGIDSNITVVTKVDDMNEIYAISKVLVSSPTAGITFEAIANLLPTVLIRPLNAIEKGNYSFLVSNGFSLCGLNKQELISSVLNLLNNEEYYQAKIDKLENISTDYTKALCDLLHDEAFRHFEEVHKDDKPEDDKTIHFNGEFVEDDKPVEEEHEQISMDLDEIEEEKQK